MKKALLMVLMLSTATLLRGQNNTGVYSITGHEVNWQTQQWDTIHPFLFLHEYDNLGNLTRHEYSSWGRGSGNKWEQRKTQKRYEYNLNGTLQYDYQEPWDTTLLVWKKQNKSEYYYHQNGNIDSVIWKSWDNNSQSYVAYTKFEHQYNAQNNLIEEISYEAFNTSWLNSIRHTYKYDTNNKLILETYAQWDKNSTIWKPISRSITYIYSVDGKLYSKMDSIRSSITNSIEPTNYFSYGYDNNGLLIEILEQIWNKNTSKWTNEYLTNYIHNTSGKVDYLLRKAWDGNAWDDNYREFYSYVPLTGIQSKNRTDCRIFPNPTSDYVFIETKEPILEITLSDIAGKVMRHEYFISNNMINVNDVPKGIYILNYKTRKNTFSTRIVKM